MCSSDLSDLGHERPRGSRCAMLDLHGLAEGKSSLVLEGVLRVGKCDGGCDNMHMCP